MRYVHPAGDWGAPLRSVPAGLRLPVRPRDGHKGTFGTVVVVGGAPGYSGAPFLAAMGAARAGAGLVRACVPETISDQVAAHSPEVMVQPLAVSPVGSVGGAAVEQVVAQLSAARALVIGPGLTTRAETAAAVLRLLETLPCPAVVDADALNIASVEDFDWRRCPEPVVITPHPGEMSRLLGVRTRDVQDDRSGLAVSYAREHDVTVVLKGVHSVVASPEGRVHVDEGDGVLSLATGGSGDVLSGVVGAFVAQGLDAFEAAVAGVTVHAEAGAVVEDQRGRAGGIASDLLEALPIAQERIRRHLEAGTP